jgi:hypothetical protein
MELGIKEQKTRNMEHGIKEHENKGAWNIEHEIKEHGIKEHETWNMESRNTEH